jgi:AraC-like DNA-binding protein
MRDTSRDLARIPSATREVLLGARPTGAAPIRLSLADAPERDRPGIYREFFGRSVFRLDVEPLGDVPFDADFTVQNLPDLMLLLGRVHGSCNRRTRAMLSDGLDHCSLMINLGGAYIISQGDRELTLGDGDATFVCAAEPTSFTHYPPGDVLALKVPHEALTPLVADMEDCYLRRIPAGTPALRLLRDYVDILRVEHNLSSCDLQHMVVAHVYDLMAIAIGATPDAAHAAQDGGLRAARLHAIKLDIADSLGQPGLSVATLAARHGCTPRSVQRLFETDGTTFTEYVLSQRLAKAHRILLDPRRAADKISAVAYDCGFGDVSYFNRMFRRQFGAVPSAIRAEARPGS